MNGPQMIDPIGRVYAGVLLDLAEQAGRTDAIADEVEQLMELLRADPGLRRLIACRAIRREERSAMLSRLFEGRVDDVLYRLIRVLNDKDRLTALPAVLGAFDEMLVERKGIVEADVFVARRLEESELAEVKASLERALGKEVVVHPYVDESLIGGLKIRVGDRLIDGSVATQLRRMRQKLVEAGRNRARARSAD